MLTAGRGRVAVAGVLAFITALLMPAPASSQPGPPETRIGWGTEAKSGAWPSMAALLVHTNPDNYHAFFCGATVVSSRWVLTSASCVQNRSAAKVDVLVGTQDLRSGGRRIAVTAIRFHPQWNRHTLNNDFALLKLARSTAARPQALGTQTVTDHTGAVTTGWGVIKWYPLTFPTKLWQGAVDTNTNAWCMFEYGSIFNPSTMLCLSARSHGSPWTGDGGGPLLVSRNGLWTQVGVLSWGFTARNPSGDPVYARVADAAPWIRQTIQG